MEGKLSESGIPEEYDRMFYAFLKESDEEEASEIEELAAEFGEFAAEAEGKPPQTLRQELVKALEHAIQIVSQLQQTGEAGTGLHQQDIKDLQSIADALKTLVRQVEGIITRLKEKESQAP